MKYTVGQRWEGMSITCFNSGWTNTIIFEITRVPISNEDVYGTVLKNNLLSAALNSQLKPGDSYYRPYDFENIFRGHWRLLLKTKCKMCELK